MDIELFALATIQKIEPKTSKVDMRISELREAIAEQEYCQNPWDPDCESSDIELYIMHQDMKIPICRLCWQKIAETDLEW